MKNIYQCYIKFVLFYSLIILRNETENANLIEALVSFNVSPIRLQKLSYRVNLHLSAIFTRGNNVTSIFLPLIMLIFQNGSTHKGKEFAPQCLLIKGRICSSRSKFFP